MGIKNYIVASVILLIAIGGYVYSVENIEYTYQILNHTFTFPVAIWMILPAFALFIASLLHMLYYGTKTFLDTRTLQKDREILIDTIGDKLLLKETKDNLRNPELKTLGEIINQLDIGVSDLNFTTSNKKIAKIVDQVLQINSGKYVSTKELKLPNENPLMIQNLKNRVELDGNFALEVVKQPSSYTQEIIKPAFIKVVQTKSLTTIKKYLENIDFDIDILKELVKKDSLEHTDFSLTNSELINVIKQVDVTNDDLIYIAKAYKQTAIPDKLIKLFEDLMSSDEKYTESYLYILAQYEMIDNIREILANSQKNEFTLYKMLIDLRDANKHYSLDTLIK